MILNIYSTSKWSVSTAHSSSQLTVSSRLPGQLQFSAVTWRASSSLLVKTSFASRPTSLGFESSVVRSRGCSKRDSTHTISHHTHWGAVVAKYTAGLTLTNSTFCPQSVFMCFVWISEKTAIISLCSINWLVFITETECLLRGTDWIFKYNSTFCPHSVFICFVWDLCKTKWHWDRFFYQYFVFRCQFRSTTAPYWSSSTRYSYEKPPNLPKRNGVSEIESNAARYQHVVGAPLCV
jgi:hypothetical protein